jgi:hypothetical protein
MDRETQGLGLGQSQRQLIKAKILKLVHSLLFLFFICVPINDEGY